MESKSGGRAQVVRHAAAVVGLILLTVAVYSTGLGGNFVLDDHWVIEKTFRDGGPGWAALFESNYGDERTQSNRLYRPLVMATYRLNFVWTGLNPHPFKVTNLAIHAFNVVLIYCLIYILIVRVAPAFPFKLPAEWISFAAAAIFSVHPIHSEAVSSIVGRAELLWAGFFLAAFIANLKMERESSAAPAVGLLCLLALLSKESAIVAGPALLVSDALLLGLAGTRRRWPRYAVIALVSVGYLAIRQLLLGGILPSAGLLGHYTFVDRCQLTAVTYAQYFVSSIFPVRLSIDHPLTLAGKMGLFPLWSYLAVLIPGWIWFRAPGLRIALGLLSMLFVVTLLPVSGAVSIAVLSADRFLYLPVLFPVLIVVLLIARSIPITPAVAALASIAVVFGLTSAARNSVWNSNRSLWESTIRDFPDHYRGHRVLADILYEEKDYQGSLDQYRIYAGQDLNHSPETFSTTYRSMADCNRRLGRIPDAMAFYEKAVAASDGNVIAWNNGAACLVYLKNYDRAAEWLKNSYRLTGNAVIFNNNMRIVENLKKNRP